MLAVIKVTTSFRPVMADVLREGRYAANAKPNETQRVLAGTVEGKDAASFGAALLAEALLAEGRVRSRLRFPGVHVTLAPQPREWLRDERWQALITDWLEAMDYGGHAYVAVLHEWDGGQHAHVVVSRVGPVRIRRKDRPPGALVNNWGDWWRGQQALDRLEQEYGLMPTRAAGRDAGGGRRRERE